MKAFVSFCKKEFTESMRTYKFIIMLTVFVILGIMNPFAAKLLPDILNGTDMGGMIIQMPEPAAIDSWAQFFSNMGQIGFLTLIIVFCGIMSNELSKGTLVNILTKGMKRRTVIFSKITVAVLIWTLCYCVSLGVTWAYTAYFWGNDAIPHAFLAFVCPWVYGLLMLALMILGGICFRSFYGSLLLTGGAVVVMSLLNIIPKIQKYNPVSLAGGTLGLISEQKVPGDFIPALVICASLTALLVAGSVVIFDRKQI